MRRIKLVPRKAIPIVTAAIFSLNAVPGFASSDTEVGAAGATGANGTVSIGTMEQIIVTPGMPGVNGGYNPASATGAPNDLNFNYATDTGGAGGNGGNGVAEGSKASVGGQGAQGGFANSTAAQQVFVSGTTIDLANSTGGVGGNGGNGGNMRFGASAAGGDGGAGGASEASATSAAQQSAGGAESEASATAVGGNGGNGGTGANSGGAGGNGGSGGLAFLGTVEAETMGPDDAIASATVVGGNGGNAASGAAGGFGSSETLMNAVDAVTTNTANLDQSATGGSGGSSANGVAGAAGNSSSILDFSAEDPVLNASVINVQSVSLAGNGGNGQNINAADGGTAQADVYMTAAAGMSAQAIANQAGGGAGDGGDVTGGTGNAGNGGGSVADIGLTSRGTTSSGVTAVGNAYGGNGGNVLDGAIGNGGIGGSALSRGGIDSASSSGTLNLTLNAFGGAGGQGAGNSFFSGGGGTAGINEANAGFEVPIGANIKLSATGGNSGSALNQATAGEAGGAIISNAVSVSAIKSLLLTATTTGGNGGSAAGGSGGLGGVATSSQTINNGLVSGNIDATLSSNGGNGGYATTLDSETPYSGGDGGSSTAYLNIVTSGSVASGIAAANFNMTTGLPAIAGGGGGTDIGTGGAGGVATATAIAESTAVGPTVDTASYSAGGVGGASLNGSGGAGGSATSIATAQSVGAPEIFAESFGGNGGGASGNGFTGGSGGNAISTATANSTSSSFPLYDATAEATGGTGGQGNNGAVSGIGGSATATATVTSIFGNATISQTVNPAGSSPGVAQADANLTPLRLITVSLLTANNLNLGAVTVTGSGAMITGITGPGTLTLGDGVNATNLQLASNSGGSSESSLIIQSGSTLDITNNHLIINYGSGPDPIATIAGYIETGYAGGTWNGPGIDSSTAALSANSNYGIGYADGADGVVAGLSSGQIEIKYTLLGDANLDGVVNGEDFTVLVANLGKSVTAWDEGDFNYDGVVSGEDFTSLVSDLGKAANGADITLPASDLAAIDAFAAANGLMADVPEPASVGLLLATGIGCLSRRRRHR